eukprot:2784499-Prymnesium_polylepis.1
MRDLLADTLGSPRKQINPKRRALPRKRLVSACTSGTRPPLTPAPPPTLPGLRSQTAASASYAPAPTAKRATRALPRRCRQPRTRRRQVCPACRPRSRGAGSRLARWAGAAHASGREGGAVQRAVAAPSRRHRPPSIGRLSLTRRCASASASSRVGTTRPASRTGARLQDDRGLAHDKLLTEAFVGTRRLAAWPPRPRALARAADACCLALLMRPPVVPSADASGGRPHVLKSKTPRERGRGDRVEQVAAKAQQPSDDRRHAGHAAELVRHATAALLGGRRMPRGAVRLGEYARWRREPAGNLEIEYVRVHRTALPAEVLVGERLVEVTVHAHVLPLRPEPILDEAAPICQLRQKRVHGALRGGVSRSVARTVEDVRRRPGGAERGVRVCSECSYGSRRRDAVMDEQLLHWTCDLRRRRDAVNELLHWACDLQITACASRLSMPQAICCKGTQPAVLGALDPNAYAGCLDDEHRPGVGRVLHLPPAARPVPARGAGRLQGRQSARTCYRST